MRHAARIDEVAAQVRRRLPPESHPHQPSGLDAEHRRPCRRRSAPDVGDDLESGLTVDLDESVEAGQGKDRSPERDALYTAFRLQHDVVSAGSPIPPVPDPAVPDEADEVASPVAVDVAVKGLVGWTRTLWAVLQR